MLCRPGDCSVPLGSLSSVLKERLMLRVQEQVKLQADYNQRLGAVRHGAAVPRGDLWMGTGGCGQTGHGGHLGPELLGT